MLILYVVWGSTYLGIAVAVETIPAFLMAAVRFVIAGAALLLWSRWRDGAAFAWPTRREWRDSLIVGGLLLAGGNGLVALGEQSVPSGIAALMIALMPAWAAVFSRAFFGARLPVAAVVGIAVGLVGVAVLVVPTGGEGSPFDPFGLGAIVLSPILWSLGSLYSQHKATLPSRPLLATSAQMLTASVVLTVMSVAIGEPGRFDLAAVSGESWLALAYLTVIGSVVAFTAYVWLLRMAPLPLIGTYAYVNPVVAVFLGTWLLQEPLTPRTLVAAAIIVFAVALIITARGRMSAPQRASAAGNPEGSSRPAARPAT